MVVGGKVYGQVFVVIATSERSGTHPQTSEES